GGMGMSEANQTGPDPERMEDEADAANDYGLDPAEVAAAAEERAKRQEELDRALREEINRVRERISKAGDLLTGPGGVYERRAELRAFWALFQDGLFLVSGSRQDDPLFFSFEGLLRRKGMNLARIAVDMSVIREAYKQYGDAGGAVRGDA